MKKVFVLILLTILLSAVSLSYGVVKGGKRAASKESAPPSQIIAPIETSLPTRSQPIVVNQEVPKPAFVKKLAVNGSLRVRYSSYQSPAVMDALSLSRARIKLSGEITPDLSFVLQPDFAGLSTGGTVALADAYGEYRCPVSGLTTRFGQFLLPFAYDSAKYKTIYGTGLDPTHYGVVMSARDYGIRVLGAIPVLAGLNGLRFDGAIVNGTGSGVDVNKSKDIVGRVNYKNSFLDIGLSGYYGHAGAAYALKRDAAIDVEYKIAPAQIVGEYIIGQNLAATAKLQETSLQVSALFGQYEPLLRYESYDPNTAITGNIVNTTTLGLTCIIDKDAKFLVNYNMVAEETTPADNNTLLFEFQMQI